MTKRVKIPKLSSPEQLAKKIRKIWELQPVTKVVPSKKLYTRKAKHKGIDGDL